MRLKLVTMLTVASIALFVVTSAVDATPSAVVVVDAVSGEDLSSRAILALVDPGGNLCGRGAAGRLDEGLAPREGGRLVVYVRGYDVADVVLEDERLPTVRVQRATGRFQVTCDETHPVKIAVKTYVLEPNSQVQSMIMDRIEFEEVVGSMEIVVPKGATTDVHCYPATEGDLIWPLAVEASPGGAWSVHVEALGTLTLEVEGATPGAYVEAFPDLNQQLDWSPDRVDGLIMWKGMLPRIGRIRGDRAIVERVPAIGFHVFGRSGPRWAYAREGPGSPGVLRFDRERVLSADVLRVDDRTPDEDSVLLPGRLDLTTVLLLIREEKTRKGMIARVDAEGSSLRLPDASVYTVWHPARGIAYLERTNTGLWSGTTQPGVVRLELPAGATVTGRVGVWAAYRGTGLLVTGFLPGAMDKADVWENEIVVRGLPLGHYRVDFQLSLAWPDGESRSWRARSRAALTIEEPLRTFHWPGD